MPGNYSAVGGYGMNPYDLDQLHRLRVRRADTDRLGYAFEQASRRRVSPASAPPLKNDTEGNTKK
jgi:hypothetical protein